MSDPRTSKLIQECERQEESCLYTSASLYIWQKRARWWRNTFIVAPIILGGIATSQIFADGSYWWAKVGAALFSLLAGFFPAIYVALGMDMRVAEIGNAASEFTNLKDRFRQAASVKSYAPYDEFEAAFEQLMDRMDSARQTSPPVPEWCFAKASKKIDAGHYSFAADANRDG